MNLQTLFGLTNEQANEAAACLVKVIDEGKTHKEAILEYEKEQRDKLNGS